VPPTLLSIVIHTLPPKHLFPLHMSGGDPRREPRRAYVSDSPEEYDGEDEEIATPLANVAVKRKSYERKRDGDQDSGYSSSSRRDMADLKVDTSRQPQPYAFVQRPDAQRRSSTQARAAVSEPLPAKQQMYYVHKKGECVVCDTYGEHLPESARSGKENIVPLSPKASKQAQPQTFRYEVAADPPIRRQSSVRGTRPATMYAPQFNYPPAQPANMMQYAAQSMSPAGWAPPTTPTLQYPPTFLYPPTVVTTTQMPDSSNFEQRSVRETRPSQSHRRSSVYGEAVVLQSKVEPRPREPQRTTSTREHVRSNSERNVRDDHDRSMPPPPRPAPTATFAHRPSIKKSNTCNTPLAASTSRRSQAVDDDTYTAPSPIRERRTEPPPTSWRGSTEGIPDRPPNRKAASYSAPTQTTSISSTLPPSQPRRSSTTATPTDTRKIIDAEAYQASRRSLTSTDLTAEALRTLKSGRNPSSRSETSSHRSHHTKSSSSAGGKSKRSTAPSEIKLSVNGMTVCVPAEQKISISTRQDGNVSISLGGTGGGEREQRRIEKAPSAGSRMSSTSKSERERERDLPEYERLKRQSTASRERSRVRRGYDYEYEREKEKDNPWKD
jgi:hypothetical protein